ncbi:MAG: tetratricopeptide repeat protein [Acidobacteriaceae bacterium]|nr:tetratricopeptide repeat protein [Acidobacteriaceae bacterium]
MKFLRLAALALTVSGSSFAVNKDMVALQRDLEAKIDAVNQSLSSKIDVLNGMLTAIQNDSRRTADQVATMQESLSTAVARSLTPVNNLNTHVDAMGEDVRSLKDALADLSGRLERMDAKITDLKNQMQIMQNPPAAPGATNGPQGLGAPTGAGPGTGTSGQPGVPPPGMSAEKTYTDARRDQQTGNLDLAYQEYQQYLTYFPNTELAANAQYYMGEISYNRADYKAAVQAFDAVLERYPKNPKTADARYMKGMALARDGQRSRAIQELRSLVQAYPNTEQARKASAALRDPHLFPSAASTAKRTTAR